MKLNIENYLIWKLKYSIINETKKFLHFWNVFNQ